MILCLCTGKASYSTPLRLKFLPSMSNCFSSLVNNVSVDPRIKEAASSAFGENKRKRVVCDGFTKDCKAMSSESGHTLKTRSGRHNQRLAALLTDRLLYPPQPRQQLIPLYYSPKCWHRIG